MRPEILFFDVGGTLLHPFPSVGAVYARAGAPFGLRSTEVAINRGFLSAWRAVQQERRRPRYGTREDQAREFWRAILASTLRSVGFEGEFEPIFRACWDAFAQPDAWAVYPDVRPTLSELKRRGIRLGLISNWDSRLPPLLAALGLAPAFDPILVSAECGFEKPDPAIFRLALERARVSAERAWHVGNHPEEDVAAAQTAGLRAFLLERKGPGPLRRLTDLLEHLDAADPPSASGTSGCRHSPR